MRCTILVRLSIVSTVDLKHSLPRFADLLGPDDLDAMSLNATDHVFNESNMDFMVGLYRQFHAHANAIKYAQSQEEREQQEERERELVGTVDPDMLDDPMEVGGSGKEKGKGRARTKSKKAEEGVALKAKKTMSRMAAGNKPPIVKQLLSTAHTRAALMCLVSINKHFRQDAWLWTPVQLSSRFHNVSGGVCPWNYRMVLSML